MPKYTCHSEYLPLKSVVIKRAEDAFISDKRIENEWQTLDYLEKPSLKEAINEYEKFQSLLGTAVDLHCLPADETVTLDSIYPRDVAVATDFGIIICNMGKKERKPEAHSHMKFYERNDISILGEIKFPGTLEGGDVAWVDETTLAVGHSYRTNEEGINQLKSLVEPHGVQILVVDLPHYKGPEKLLHLMSIFSPIDKDLAVVHSPLLPIGFRKELLKRSYKFVEVSEAELATMGCIVLAVAPKKCIILDGNPQVQKTLQDAGCEVNTYKGHHISQVGGGGPTCLTRPLKRLIPEQP